MYTRRHFFVSSFIGLLLAGCAASETRSLVSRDDIPASKYKKIAVFIENLDDAERPAAENIVVSTFQNAGVNAESGSAVFNGRSNLSEKAKAAVVQNEFDAVLYLTIVEKGVVEELIPNAFFDGQMVQFNILGLATVGHSATNLYSIHPDGTVYQSILALKTAAAIQDTQTNKQVWTSETVSTGPTITTNMPALFTQASNQIVAKMRADNAI